MTIRYEGCPLEDRDLKGALMRCDTCGDSRLYNLGKASADSVSMDAEGHDKITRQQGAVHDILV